MVALVVLFLSPATAVEPWLFYYGCNLHGSGYSVGIRSSLNGRVFLSTSSNCCSKRLFASQYRYAILGNKSYVIQKRSGNLSITAL